MRPAREPRDIEGYGQAFHDVGRLFASAERRLVWTTPETTVGSALQLMVEHKFSVLPVIESGELRGVFSLWTLAKLVMNGAVKDVDKLLVDDVMDEPLRLVTVEERLDEVLNIVERDEAVLVGTNFDLTGILTSWDILRYFYEATKAFVLIGEIELALRDLIARAFPGDRLAEAIDRGVGQRYREREAPVPKSLHELSFDEYRSVVTARSNWEELHGLLGASHDLVNAKLTLARKIRNDALHFRRELSVADYETLAGLRSWLLQKTRKLNRP